MTRRMLLALAAAATLAGCASYDDRGRYGYDDRRGYDYDDYRYEGSDYARRGGNPFRGSGAHLLDPWLAETREGQQLVRMGWRGARNGRIDEALAHRVNIWFRRYADADRDLCLTDEEIRVALVLAVEGPRRYPRR